MEAGPNSPLRPDEDDLEAVLHFVVFRFMMLGPWSQGASVRSRSRMEAGPALAAPRPDEDDLESVVHDAVLRFMERPGAGGVSACAIRTVIAPAPRDTASSSAPRPARPVSRYPTPRRLA